MANRIQAIRISYELLQRWITEGAITNFEVIKGIPPGAKFEGAEAQAHDVAIFFSHSSFPEVPAVAGKFRGFVEAVPIIQIELKEI